MLRLRAEIPGVTPTFRPTPAEVATTIAGSLAYRGDVHATSDEIRLLIIATLDVGNSLEHHQNAAHALLRALEDAQLYAVRVVATRVATRLAEGALTGLVGGAGIGTKARSDVAPWVTLASTLLGGFVGNFFEKEIDLFEWNREQDGRWYAVENSPAQPQSRYGWA